jgi:hypothetical protein
MDENTHDLSGLATYTAEFELKDRRLAKELKEYPMVRFLVYRDADRTWPKLLHFE